MTGIAGTRTQDTSSRTIRYLCACLPHLPDARGRHIEAGTMQERWKTFAGGNYEASNLGNVRRKTPGRKTRPGRLLTLNKMKIGYLRVGPIIDGRVCLMYVHKIIAELFIGPCPAGKEVNHKDGDKTNNRVANLEYVTHQKNMVHAWKTGLISIGRRSKQNG